MPKFNANLVSAIDTFLRILYNKMDWQNRKSQKVHYTIIMTSCISYY